jgi:hypothetical protein
LKLESDTRRRFAALRLDRPPDFVMGVLTAVPASHRLAAAALLRAIF